MDPLSSRPLTLESLTLEGIHITVAIRAVLAPYSSFSLAKTYLRCLDSAFGSNKAFSQGKLSYSQYSRYVNTYRVFLMYSTLLPRGHRHLLDDWRNVSASRATIQEW